MLAVSRVADLFVFFKREFSLIPITEASTASCLALSSKTFKAKVSREITFCGLRFHHKGEILLISMFGLQLYGPAPGEVARYERGYRK